MLEKFTTSDCCKIEYTHDDYKKDDDYKKYDCYKNMIMTTKICSDYKKTMITKETCVQKEMYKGA